VAVASAGPYASLIPNGNQYKNFWGITASLCCCTPPLCHPLGLRPLLLKAASNAGLNYDIITGFESFNMNE